MPGSPPIPVVPVPPGQALTGAGMLAATNFGTTQLGGGGPEVAGLAAFLNLFAQIVKQPAWFREHEWLIPAMLLVGAPLALFLAHGDGLKGFINLSLATFQAIQNYHWLGGTGMTPLSSTPQENSTR